MFTTIAFTESQSVSAFGKVAGLADEHVTVSGDDITVPELDQVIAIQALSETLARLRLNTPSLRKMWLPEFSEFLEDSLLPTLQAVDEAGSATFEVTKGLGFIDLTQNPFQLKRSEKLNVEIINGASERGYIIVWLADGIQAIERGQIFTIRATNTDTLVADTWTNGALVLDDTLPAGRYGLVGMSAQSATLIAARCVFVGGSWRPGCLGKTAFSDSRPDIFRRGKLGIWGTFNHDQQPTIDFLARAGDSSQIVHLDLIQLSSL